MRTIILILGFSLLVFNGNLFAQQDSAWTLEKCIDYAYDQNIQIQKAELANSKYGLYAEQAKAQRFPSLSASVNENFNWRKNSTSGETGLTASNGTSYSANSGITLFNSSRITNLIRQAELDISGGSYSLETLKESISLDILNAYLQVLYSEELVNNSKKQIESSLSQLNLADERLKLEIISQSDYSQVKSQLASEKLTLANSENQLAIAKVNLMQLMEYPVTKDFTIVKPDLGESLNENLSPDAGQVYETALGIKPQVKNAGINKEIASLDEKLAKAMYFPSLSANAGLSTGYSSNVTGGYSNQMNSSLVPTLGLSLSVPIYQKKQAKTELAVARIAYKDAELSETDTKNQLRKSIEQACQDVISAQIEYEASLEKFMATKESLSLSEEKFTQGIINSVDYLVSKTNLIVSESELLQSKYNLIFSYKLLGFYQGTPLSL